MHDTTRYIQIHIHTYRYIQIHTHIQIHTWYWRTHQIQTDTFTILLIHTDTTCSDTDRYIQDTYSQYLVCICMHLYVSVCIMSVFAPQNLLGDSVKTYTYKYKQIHTDTDRIQKWDTDKYIQIHTDKFTLKTVFKSLFLFNLDSISIYHDFIRKRVVSVCICLYWLYQYVSAQYQDFAGRRVYLYESVWLTVSVCIWTVSLYIVNICLYSCMYPYVSVCICMYCMSV